MIHHLQIFTDGSVNTQSKVGYGAYLLVSDLTVPIDSLKKFVQLKRFEQTSSTALELQTLLWALNEVIRLNKESNIKVTTYTDSQNIIGLPERRERLEKSHYCSGKQHALKNAELYQAFYQITSDIDCEFVKVAGHQPSGQKNTIDRLFALVDRASRRALRGKAL